MEGQWGKRFEGGFWEDVWLRLGGVFVFWGGF